MTGTFVDRRAFDQAAQQAFALLSGDYNPKHVDREAARRMFFGRQVVHGMHLVLWSLEELCAAIPDARAIRSISVLFVDACGIDEILELSGVCEERQARIAISKAGRPAAQIKLEISADLTCPVGFGAPTFRQDSRLLEASDIEGRKGAVPLIEPDGLREMFPALAEKFDKHQIAMLFACTRLVGMECPGLNSIFAGFKLRWDGQDQEDQRRLSYDVTYWNPDLRLVRMNVVAGAGKGRIEAILHPPDVMQPGVDDVRANVAPHEFVGRHALVIGGSRGLGEVVAKIIALGGGRATITYWASQVDALRIRDDLASAEALCDVLAFDVVSDRAPQIGNGSPFTDLFYFATPQIRQDAAMGPDALAVYQTFYSDGLRRSVEAFRERLAGAAIFYPSTVYVDEPNPKYAAYAEAKRRGEQTAESLAREHRMHAFVSRLPRLRTGQTSSLGSDDSLEPLPFLLQLIRQMQSEQVSKQQ